jgi:hypothetical protein
MSDLMKCIHCVAIVYYIRLLCIMTMTNNLDSTSKEHSKASPRHLCCRLLMSNCTRCPAALCCGQCSKVDDDPYLEVKVNDDPYLMVKVDDDP